jgi:hypothetical protein
MFFSPPSILRTLKISGADTAAHLFTAQPARFAVFQAPTGNAGTVTILGVDGTGAADADGLVLAAGDVSPAMPCRDLGQLAYKFSNAADFLKVLYAL